MTALSDKMRALAGQGHKRALELRIYAKAFDDAAEVFYSGKPVPAAEEPVRAKAFLGAWARARKLWCECSGEPLV